MKNCDIFYNMLQTEKAQEAGFFSNSHPIVDLDVLKEEIEQEAQIKVELYYKAIYRGKMAVEKDDKTIIRAIYIELETDNFNKNFKNLYLSIDDLQQALRMGIICVFSHIPT